MHEPRVWAGRFLSGANRVGPASAMQIDPLVFAGGARGTQFSPGAAEPDHTRSNLLIPTCDPAGAALMREPRTDKFVCAWLLNVATLAKRGGL